MAGGTFGGGRSGGAGAERGARRRPVSPGSGGESTCAEPSGRAQLGDDAGRGLLIGSVDQLDAWRRVLAVCTASGPHTGALRHGLVGANERPYEA